MKIDFNRTGGERKALVTEIGEILRKSLNTKVHQHLFIK